MQPRHRKVIGIPDKHPIPIHSKSNMFQTQSIIFLFCCPNSGKFPIRIGYRKNINQKPHAQWVIGLSVSVGTFRLRELKKIFALITKVRNLLILILKVLQLTKNGYLFLRPIMKCGLRSSAPYNREMTVCSSSRDFF